MNKKLIKKILSGDDNAFSQVVDEYKNYVFAIILNFIKDYDEVENVAQEVFLQVYISLPDFKIENFKGWIGRIAVNKSIDWKRKNAKIYTEERIGNSEEMDNIKELNYCKTPEDMLIQKESREIIYKLCNSIPSIYKDVIIKFYFEEKSYEEIAHEEGTTVKTIASRLYRGRNILKEKWREENETL
ncbi:sigma-70 family RNA polymerase sigma factor [Acidilutibacter cellobiosedens]|uniref:Sigma-70 family RNA polymerase sigma factor n=1 Tax=Acidilutibacter cellobiosedens TaxID=2507161 RepID=A0A410Q9X1_9FIRM|nr:sigma-70 family RNA polymerase sigma factor [Acidilutibacter cellobiosedens]MBE6081591.1 sigma-70 family RNA polymerase sigma factor [Tissierellaceae bacterium]QAT60776.1 sigma-70 family RNA polymerase sigma factor [Acidilutibacter cellobiosedens]